MEVDIMELRGLYLNSFISLLVSCTSPLASESVLILEDTDQRFSTSVELVMLDKTAFSGRMYGFYLGSQDTAYISSYRNGLLHGTQLQFWENGFVKEQRFFDQGEKEGAYISWWPNGQKQFEYFFESGEYEGELKEWNSEGMLTRIMNYEKGYESGVQKWWYDSGEIKANYVIKNGRRYGLLGTKNCTNVSDSVFVSASTVPR
jgi:antitoxin component YwqK of YwqJK toxin-antitoxin module